MGKGIRFTVVILFSLLLSAWSQEKVIKKYVAESDAKLLASTIGRPIAMLAKGAECTVLRQQGELVQVQITGWIAKSALLDSPLLHALHIMVESKEKAEQILVQLRSGKSFEELARTYSIAPSASRGGDIGYFKKGDFDLKFETAIVSLGINEVSPIIESDGKYNIFKRIE